MVAARARRAAAHYMGLDRDRGTLAPGKRADLVLLDDRLVVRSTMVGGRIVYSRDPSST
ncbi:MAG: amidohydrolase family protein [Armatimonadota bacterium]|nr:amidohydrolase family protein [Armatimonadota bacterium]